MTTTHFIIHLIAILIFAVDVVLCRKNIDEGNYGKAASMALCSLLMLTVLVR